MAENTHVSSGQSSAIFVTPEQKAAGIDPAAVAAAAAAAARGAVVASSPGQRGITVQHVAGPQVSAGVPRVLPADPAPAAPITIAAEGGELRGLSAIVAARALGIAVSTPLGPVPIPLAEQIAAHAPDSVSVQITPEQAARLLAPSPSTPEPANMPLPPAGGTGGGTTDEAAARSYARAPGAELSIQIRGHVQIVSPVPVRLTHERDPDHGIDVVTVQPETDGDDDVQG